MPIDRSRFLLLTAALATAACNQAKPGSESKAEAKGAKDGDKAAADDSGDTKKEGAPSTPETSSTPSGSKAAPAPAPVDEVAPAPVTEHLNR